MKLKSKKFISFLLVLLLLIGATISVPTIANVTTNEVIVRDYYVRSNGYEVDDTADTTVNGDGRNQNNPAPNVATVIDTIIADKLGKGDIANVYILQDDDGYTEFDSTTAYQNEKGYYKHNMTTWTDTGTTPAEWDFTMVVKSPDGQQNYLTQTAYIGLKGTWYINGPTIFENVVLTATSNQSDRPIVIKDNDVTFSKTTNFTVMNKNGSGQTIAKASDLYDVGASFFPICLAADSSTYSERVNLNVDLKYLFKANSNRIERLGVMLASIGNNKPTFKEDVNIVVDNSESQMQFTFGGNDASARATFEKTLNINVKNADTILVNNSGTGDATVAEKGSIVVGNGLQMIYPSTVVTGVSLGRKTFTYDEVLGTSFVNEIVKKGITNYWVMQRVSENSDIIDFAKDANGNVIAGTFSIKEGYVAIATDSNGNEYSSKKGTLDLSKLPGAYTVTFIADRITYDFYVAHGGTGDGTDKNNPAPSVAIAVTTMNEIGGLTANDTVNVWIMQDIDKVKNDGSIVSSGTTYNKHNLAVWGSVPKHTAKISVKPHPDNQTKNSQVNLPTYLAITDIVGINTKMNFAGPTEIDNIKIVYCTNTNLTNSQYGILIFNSNNVKLGSDVKYCYADTTKANSVNWVGSLIDKTSLTAAITPAGTTEMSYPNSVDIEIAHSITGGSTGGYVFLPAYSPAYVTFQKDVTLKFTGSVDTGRVQLAKDTSACPLTFKQNLNVKITEKGGSWEMKVGDNYIVEGGVQMIVSDAVTTRGSSYPFSTLYSKAYTDSTYKTPITNHWILNVNDAMVEAIDFIENEKGKFKIPQYHSAVATNNNDASIVREANANGILDLSDVPGEYTVVIKELERESDTYKDSINYRGYNSNITKYNGALANINKKLATNTELNVVYMGGTAMGTLREQIGDWLQTNYPNVKINNIDKSLDNTGTTFGAMRVKRDVLSKTPDLVFIEYSFDDYTLGVSAEKSQMQFETIVREIKSVYPNCDIVTLFVSTADMGDELYDQALAQEEICEKYSISSINLGSKSDTYYNIIKEFLSNILLFGEYGSGYELTEQVLPEVTSKYLYDGNTNFIFPIDVKFTTAGGASYNSEEKGLGIPDYVGVITVPAKSSDTITINFEGTELYLLTSENISSDNTFKVTVDGESTKIKHYSGNVLTKVVAGLESGKHTVVIETAIDSQIGICGFYNRDIEKNTNKLNICDLVYLDETQLNKTENYRDYNNDGKIDENDISALKKILLSKWEKPDYFSTSHLIPIARLGWRPYTGNIPQQSIPSYEKAYETGHRIMLCDIRLTSDGYMVCCHDDDISKVNAYDSNGVKVPSGTVKISETTLEELLTYDFGKHKTGYAGLQIMQPKEFLEFCAQYDDITPVFEFKTIDDARITQLINLIKQYGFENNVMFLAGADNGPVVGSALPNAVIGRWYSRVNDSVINLAESFGSAGKFVHVDTKTYESEDTVSFENYVKAKAKGVDLGITYIGSNAKDYFNELKNRGIFNFCKYISLDEVSWLYE